MNCPYVYFYDPTANELKSKSLAYKMAASPDDFWKSFHKCSFALLPRQIPFCISVEYEKNTLLHTKLIFLAGEQNLGL